MDIEAGSGRSNGIVRCYGTSPCHLYYSYYFYYHTHAHTQPARTTTTIPDLQYLETHFNSPHFPTIRPAANYSLTLYHNFHPLGEYMVHSMIMHLRTAKRKDIYNTIKSANAIRKTDIVTSSNLQSKKSTHSELES